MYFISSVWGGILTSVRLPERFEKYRKYVAEHSYVLCLLLWKKECVKICGTATETASRSSVMCNHFISCNQIIFVESFNSQSVFFLFTHRMDDLSITLRLLSIMGVFASLCQPRRCHGEEAALHSGRPDGLRVRPAFPQTRPPAAVLVCQLLCDLWAH